ncbi:MAG TPA: sugar kinase [Verrucomicrobiales bacterium]|nr:sugar kinase [Verrucomicrobiales bacterium]HCN78302.1 sugar kinase [Verrucomicrobiales bacterium]HRJ08139.1 ROK family protein [Prosthecobacter sp.]HRK13788.1 ROK family protein [Prosthecobacter sp.]
MPTYTTSVGIDFGGTSVKLGVCRDGELLCTDAPIPTANFPGPAALIGEMAARVAKLKEKFPAIAAIGVGVPGLVDFEHGFVHVLTNVPGWKHVPLKAILGEKTGLPVIVENDANAMAYAEFRYGAGRGMNNVVALTMGTGIGGGLILNGQLYRGSGCAAGEIGQMSIHFDGVAGHYGNLGALEKYTGNQQIAEHAMRRYAEAHIQKSAEDCTPKKIAEAAQAGDDIARQVWDEIADWLGTALASIAWLLNPDAFVIGGGVAQAGDLIFGPLNRKVQSMLSTVVWERLQILPARFSNESGIIGNAALAADSLG